MIEQLNKALKRVKDDALSKAIYDLGKYFFLLFLSVIGLYLLPEKNSINNFFKTEIRLTYLNGILFLLVISFIVAILVSLFFRKQITKMRFDASVDELTGLYNHKYLKIKMLEYINFTKIDKKPLSMILMDIDDFKEFNVKYGFQIADEIMIKLGTLLKSDSRATDLTFRQHYKGDEFIILAKETSLENAVRAANRKRELIQKTGFEIKDGQVVYLTVCCGVVEFNHDKDSEDSFLTRGQSAMFKAKALEGKNSTISLV